MSKNQLKTYDISLFDIEQEYNKQIAPIEKKIEKLNSQLDSKSISAHKDFLSKEKKSKTAINTLQEKTTLRIQRIEKAVENKVIKLKNKKQRLNEQLDVFKNEQNELREQELAVVLESIQKLKDEEQERIDEIKKKYKTNIESYFEKLDIYTSNYNKNHEFHQNEIKRYQEVLEEQLSNIDKNHKEILSNIEDRLQRQIEKKIEADEAIKQNSEKDLKPIYEVETLLRQQINVELDQISAYISPMKQEKIDHYQTMISTLSNDIFELRKNFEDRRLLIEQDLELNIQKQNNQLENLGQTATRKQKRNINAKINLFQARATTVMKYEENILEQQMTQLSREIDLLRERLNNELLNIEKLKVFLTTDQSELKETGKHLKTVNLNIKKELDNFEYTNNEYIKKHSELKTEFNKNYVKIFKMLKEALVTISSTYLNTISTNNFKLDEISKFLDTAEPQKEIKVNDLREAIEVNEVNERYKLKYAKEQFDLDIINDKYNTIILQKEENIKIELSELQQQISEIRNKETFDIAVENAKLKQTKANEIHKLRQNNTKLERNILTNKYQTEIDILELKKELEAINTRKHNSLLIKELEATIKNYELEVKYQDEVIKKGLEETTLDIQEKQQKIESEKETFNQKWTKEKDEQIESLTKQKETLKEQTDNQRDMIKMALERELKEPTKNKLRAEAIIDERLSKLDSNNIIYIDYIHNIIDSFKGNLLSTEQLHEVIINNTSMYDHSQKYLTNSYRVLKEALQFMNEIEVHSLNNKIAASTDSYKTRRLNKQLAKLKIDSDKQMNLVNQSEEDHKTVNKAFIETELSTLKRENPESIEHLITLTENVYYKVFDKLKSIQESVQTETNTLYSSLTKNDKEIINNAKENATIALQKLEENYKQKLEPINQEINSYLDSKNEEKKQFMSTFNQEIEELNNQINHLKNEAQQKAGYAKDDKRSMIEIKKEQQKTLDETIEQQIVKKYEKIDSEIKTLKENYNQAVEQIDNKEFEHKKIYDFEDRIYNIAVSNATSRLNEANKKSIIVQNENTKLYQKHIKDSEKLVETNKIKYNKELLQLSKQFERNIFTTRPRIEESIGDAQKAIDIEINEKQLLFSSILDENNKLMQSADTSLLTTFTEAYDKLQDNLSTYLDKYRVIEQAFIKNNNDTNERIKTNYNELSLTLFHLTKSKNEANVVELERINSSIHDEEV